ncbi:PRC-barrel domain-containing protein [Microvirga sp. BT688]|uniref:PRC-barrel domain-containing protein n=1 Tax=Microvirga sp. TaxID=1873136 RepID=UPI00168533F3|nr:PRC-barrel domain-containing protein [Microvirga sp.]MBD2750329.1 PRC-barrel domain-containing protein [Microvirga sp.]
MHKLSLKLSTALALLILPFAAYAQQSQGAPKPAPATKAAVEAKKATAQQHMSLISKDAADKVNLAGADVLYKGWRAAALLDEDVYGANGQQLGEVENILVGPDGQITAIVIKGGGFLGISDAAFRVPWNKVDMTAAQDGIKVSLTEERAEDLGLFDGPDWVVAGPREWRVTELIGDYARLRNGLGFGYVADVVFGRDGQLLATLVNRDVAYGAGLYGYPYYGWGYGWYPRLDYYALPYDTPELAAAPTVAYDNFNDEVL